MPRHLTQMQRAERWYFKQILAAQRHDEIIRNTLVPGVEGTIELKGLFYEPEQLLKCAQDKTLHDILQAAKQLNVVTKFKL